MKQSVTSKLFFVVVFVSFQAGANSARLVSFSGGAAAPSAESNLEDTATKSNGWEKKHSNYTTIGLELSYSPVGEEFYVLGGDIADQYFSNLTSVQSHRARLQSIYFSRKVYFSKLLSGGYWAAAVGASQRILTSDLALLIGEDEIATGMNVRVVAGFSVSRREGNAVFDLESYLSAHQVDSETILHFGLKASIGTNCGFFRGCP